MNYLLWFLLLGGIGIHIGGRNTGLLYFDVAFALYLAYQFATGHWIRLNTWVTRLGAFCVLSGVLSALFNYRDINKSLAALKVLCVGLLVYAVARKKQVNIFNLSAWGAVTGLLLLLDFENVRFGEYEGIAGLKQEIEISMGRSNYIASILLLLIPLAVAGIALYKGWKRIACAGFTALMLVGLLVTMSRGGMLALTVAIVVCIPLLWKVGVRTKQWATGLALTGIVFVMLPIDLLTTNAALIVYRMDNADDSRLELMQASWKSFADHPILGVGPGQLGDAIAHRVVVPDFDAQYLNAHNLILNAFAEYGFLAGLALLIMVALVLRWAWRGVRQNPSPLSVALFLGILAALLHNMMEASFEGEQFQVVFWIVAAMAERISSFSHASHCQL